MTNAFDPRLITVGDTVSRVVRYTRDDIATFARMSFDENPLHVNPHAAQRARFGDIIASGQQTAAVLMGMLATYFSRSDDGVAREMLCLNMNFAFKSPVFAECDVMLRWRVTRVEPNAKLNGLVGQLDGQALVVDPALPGAPQGKPAVVARGTILVTPPTR